VYLQPVNSLPYAARPEGLDAFTKQPSPQVATRAIDELARILGQQAARAAHRERGRGLANAWLPVVLMLVAALLAAGMVFAPHLFTGR
jgi:hypothetical protein